MMKTATLNLTQEWDKTFPKSDKVNHSNKELLLIPDAVHTDLYDGGANKVIPFDKLERFFAENLK